MQYKHSNHTAIFFDNGLNSPDNKMGVSYIHYHADKVVCIIDNKLQEKSLQAYYPTMPDVEIVTTVEQAVERGVDTVIIADMPNGGRLTQALKYQIDQMVEKGLSVVNGLHDYLAPLYSDLKAGQYIYDLRQVESKYQCKAMDKARHLANKRVLLVGSDMAVGKMTAGLQMYYTALQQGLDTCFLATGQVGITIVGQGIPLDAIALDFTGGAVEKLVCDHPADITFIEGQGAINNPGSAATLPLLRGAMPTHLIFCHKTALDGRLKNYPQVKIPDIKDLIQLYEDLGSACGAFHKPKTIGICVNTAEMTQQASQNYLQQLSVNTGLVAIDPMRTPSQCARILELL